MDAHSEVIDQLFVYGTLRSGEAPRSMFAEHVISTRPATVRGAIYALPDGYPGLIPDDNRRVVGEVVRLQDLPSAFSLLDAYEGDQFARVMQKAQFADGSACWVWCYHFADREIARRGVLIQSGDWIAYRRQAQLQAGSDNL